MRLQDFDFELPGELIAQHPVAERAASRLLVVHDSALEDAAVRDLPRWLEPGDLMVFNDTRVIKARLHGFKASGGRVEILIERILDDRTALAQIRASHAPRPGSVIHVGEDSLQVRAREETFYRLETCGDTPLAVLLERHGRLPLPPYIHRPPAAEDEARYQTIYARVAGAVAAPTAGLHFDAALLDRLRVRGVNFAYLTLHVGAGTFAPVRVEDLAAHRMHTERYEVPEAVTRAVAAARAQGKRVVAVGTTTLRALESAAASGELRAGAGDTSLFIRPGYTFRVVDRLLTNFHLPKSTLLMLVCAFAGTQTIRQAYAHAVRQRYRFFSYGDAMFLSRT